MAGAPPPLVVKYSSRPGKSGGVPIDISRDRQDILSNYPAGNPFTGLTYAIEKDFNEKKKNLEAGLQTELDAVDAKYPPLPKGFTPEQWLERAAAVVTELLNKKRPMLDNELDIVQRSASFDKLQASYNAVILNDQISSLQERLNKLNAESNKRRAEAQRAAAEVEADYKARKANIEKKVQSELDQAGSALPQLSNPTPEQWLERATQLVTQAIANKKKLQTANNALIAKAPNALEKQKATYNADLLVDEIASLQARLDKLNAETARRKEIARQAAIRAANTYAMPANGSVVATAAGRGLIQVAQGAASLAQAISDAIAVLGRVLASAPSVMAVGFASLTYSSRTAEQWQDQTPDSVRYALGMDANKLGLPSSVNLNAVAKAGGTVDLPMRLTNEARGNTTTLSVLSTDGVSVPKAVPVRMAAYNAATGLYEVTVPSTAAEAPPLILTWTPASPPGNQNPSSTTPVVPKPVPVYEGATLTPVKAEPESYPGIPLDLDDLIVIFPADSGVKPVYVMLSSPLDSGIFTRRQLQKKFDSHKYDFGLGEKSANNGTLAEFRDKILEHLADPATVEKGTYHSEVNSKVHYNARTNIVVIIGGDGMFVSGWRIEPGTDQYNFYMKNEVL